MKIKLAAVRSIIKEEIATKPHKLSPQQKKYITRVREGISARALFEAKEPTLPEWQGFHVGEWVTLSNGHSGEIKAFKQKNLGAPNEYVLAVVNFGEHWMEQKADIMLKDATLATPKEVSQTKQDWEAHSAHVARTINTSREGT